MSYIEAAIEITPYSDESAELVMAVVEELGFESFTMENPCLKGYIRQKNYSAQQLKCLLSFFDNSESFKVSFSAAPVKEENWNLVWESHFEPIVIDKQCTVKASFHKGLPLTRYNIKIEPKMAFGTGHHQTTAMMVKWLLKIGKDKAAARKGRIPSLHGLQVLDMGTGTGVLAVLAAKMGAQRPVHAVDVDITAVNSAKENVWKNRLGKAVTVLYGDASLIQASKYDLILANINRNILLEDISTYARGLKSAAEVHFQRGRYAVSGCLPRKNAADGGLLVISGFYKEDVPLLKTEAEKQGLKYVGKMSRDNWCSVCFVRK